MLVDLTNCSSTRPCQLVANRHSQATKHLLLFYFNSLIIIQNWHAMCITEANLKNTGEVKMIRAMSRYGSDKRLATWKISLAVTIYVISFGLFAQFYTVTVTHTSTYTGNSVVQEASAWNSITDGVCQEHKVSLGRLLNY